MAATQQANPAAINAVRRDIILRGGVSPETGVYYPPAVDMWQRLNPNLPSSITTGTTITAPLKNVGLIKRLLVEIKATVTAGATSQQNLTKLGLANLIDQVTLTDFGNIQRIQSVPGWLLMAVSSAKRKQVFGAAYTTDTPMGYGNINNRTIYAPTSIAANGSSEVDITYEVPFVKNDIDLRGALFADVNQAQATISFRINPSAFVASTADATGAVYQSAGADVATISNVSVQITQIYLDQLPRNPQTMAVLLPGMDLGTAYMMSQTSSGLPVANQDNTYPFLNQRSYESLTWIFDNNGTLNANASDINYLRLTSANLTNILDLDPKMICLRDRMIFGGDPPQGMHYLDFRSRPIDTNQYGNMTVVISPSSVGGSGAVFLYGWEMYGVLGVVNQGGSLPSGGGM